VSTFPSLRSAAAYAGVSHEIIRVWSIAYGIGNLENGKWAVSKDGLDRIIAAREHITEIRQTLKQSA
jgi:hypothetical protein